MDEQSILNAKEKFGTLTKRRTYIAIDLKSFYASVECMERNLDPLTTNLVVADAARTEKTICLAVSPSLKKYGIPGRPRLFEVVQKVREVNAQRKIMAPKQKFAGESYDAKELEKDPSLAVGYIAAPPQMAHYIEWSTRIYNIYLKYIAPEDIHVYSIDEIFADITSYLKGSGLSPYEFTRQIILDVYETTGITATAGIGTNLYLCKVAMDIVAKKIPADGDGVRIACLDEMNYRKLLWDHRPLTDFWRVGRGYASKLEENGLYTMGDIARCSLGSSGEYYNEDLLYKLFGINAELLIDHAWGWEPCTMKDVKAYKPENSSISSGQVLHCPYTFDKARVIVAEMIDQLVLDLVDKRMMTDQMVLTIGYDIENLTDPSGNKWYKGPVTVDHYGRRVPKHAHGTVNLKKHTSSTKQIMEAVLELYDRIVDPVLLVRRVTLAAGHILEEWAVKEKACFEQLDLFTDYKAEEQRRVKEQLELDKEKRIQQAVLSVKKRYGKNALLRGMNLQEGATGIDRNNQIGGHKA